MGLLRPTKVEKMKISAYGNNRRAGLAAATFKVPFNPESVEAVYEHQYAKTQGINTTGREAKYSSSKPIKIQLDMIIDGTGVVPDTSLTLIPKSVKEQIAEFMDACYFVNGDIHQPNHLKIQWGDSYLQNFDCALEQVSVKYTHFEPSGTPLRAVLACTFVEDMEASKRRQQNSFSSPDLSHSRIVKAGDTLPALCKQIYGTSQYYLRVAAFNGLDNFRQLAPGTQILFPPLESES